MDILNNKHSPINLYKQILLQNQSLQKLTSNFQFKGSLINLDYCDTL